MKVRDGHGCLCSIYQFNTNKLEIVADDHRPLFRIKLVENGIEVTAGSACKHNHNILDNALTILPHARNQIVVKREPI
jgi:hypothetical protein